MMAGEETRLQRLGRRLGGNFWPLWTKWVSASASWPDVRRASVAEVLVPGGIGGPSLLNPADPAVTIDLEPHDATDRGVAT